MKQVIAITCYMLFAIAFNSCGIFSNKNLAKRHRNTKNVEMFGNATDPQSFVQVDLNSSIIRESTSAPITFNVLSLTDKGQEAFIHSANEKSSDSKELMELLTTNFIFSKEAKASIKIIPKTIKKSLVFTIERLKVDPGGSGTTFNLMGDRVAFLELKVQIPAGNNAVFDSWDRYVTDHYTLNLGKVTAAQQWNASLNLSAKGSGEMSITGANSSEDFESDKTAGTTTLVNTGQPGSMTNANNFELLNTGKGTKNSSATSKAAAELGGSGTIGFTDKYETSLDLTSRILKLSGSLSTKKILLRQESGQGLDLSGNVVVSLEYAITSDWAPPIQFTKIKELYNAGVPVASNSLKVSYLTVVFPDITADIMGQVDYSFLYRQVNKGNQHLPEARQKVKFWYGKVPYNQNTMLNRAVTTLIRKEEIRPKEYQIKFGAHILKLGTNELAFESVTEAASFLRYIGDAINASVNIGTITINGGAVNSGNYGNLKIVTHQH